MMQALTDEYHVARQTLEEANDVLGYDLMTIMLEGPESSLTATENTQPALFAAGIATLRTLYELLGEDFQPAMVAGHSLGELTALSAAGAMTFPDGLKLVRIRGELMRDADQHSPGGMAALLGIDADGAEALCASTRDATGHLVVVANDNCPGQVVIAGEERALTAAMDAAGDYGVRKVVRLEVSIAAHSSLMARVQDQFRAALAATPFHPPMIPIIGNTTALPLTTVDQVRAELGDQLTSSVRWTESVQAMRDAGIDTFVELGSKDVLCGLIKRIDRGTTRYAVDSPESMQTLL
jgi:[acyl-carrier-protein] S-malonyltransferase